MEKVKEHLRQVQQATKTSMKFNNKTAAFLSSHNQENTQLPLKESLCYFRNIWSKRQNVLSVLIHFHIKYQIWGLKIHSIFWIKYSPVQKQTIKWTYFDRAWPLKNNREKSLSEQVAVKIQMKNRNHVTRLVWQNDC